MTTRPSPRSAIATANERGEQERARRVDVEHPLPEREIRPRERSRLGRAGVVDEQVDAPGVSPASRSTAASSVTSQIAVSPPPIDLRRRLEPLSVAPDERQLARPRP